MSKFSTGLLGDYIENERFATLPDDVVEKAKLCFLDSLGCFHGAHSSPFAETIGRFRDALTVAPAGCCGRGKQHRDPAARAFDAALMINALDYDDIYWKGHPGATVIAAVLGLADHVDCSGQELIEAIAVGYEVGCRVGMSLVNSTPRKTIHGHGTWQVFGAAAAAAKLLRLPSEQAAQALAIAAANAPVASVMKTVYGASCSMAKNNFGPAAHAGVTAAFLAKAGFTGPLDVFEGDTGFWRMAGADSSDGERLTHELGHRYEILDVGFKAYSCCRIIQSSIEAVMTAAAKFGGDFSPSDIRSVVVAAPAIVCAPPFSVPTPPDMWSAQFSAPYAIVMALLGEDPGPDWFRGDRLASAVVAELTAKIALEPYKGQSTGHHAAEALIVLADGRSTKATTEVATGEASNPLAREFLRRKFLRLASGRLGMEGAEMVSSYVDTIERREKLDVQIVMNA